MTLHDEAKNMGGLQAGSDWDAYTDAQWESWNGYQLGTPNNRMTIADHS